MTFDKLMLWCARGAILRAMLRIRHEKETSEDAHHKDGECGFQLVSELFTDDELKRIDGF